MWFQLIILRTTYHRALIFYWMIGLGRYMTSIDIKFVRSKVKVTMIAFVKKLCPLIILRTVHQRAFKFQKHFDNGRQGGMCSKFLVTFVKYVSYNFVYFMQMFTVRRKCAVSMDTT